MIGLDDQFKYDFSEWNILLIVIFLFGFFLGFLIIMLYKQAERDQEQQEALDFLVRQAEEFNLYELEKNQIDKGNKNV